MDYKVTYKSNNNKNNHNNNNSNNNNKQLLKCECPGSESSLVEHLVQGLSNPIVKVRCQIHQQKQWKLRRDKQV